MYVYVCPGSTSKCKWNATISIIVSYKHIYRKCNIYGFKYLLVEHRLICKWVCVYLCVWLCVFKGYLQDSSVSSEYLRLSVALHDPPAPPTAALALLHSESKGLDSLHTPAGYGGCPEPWPAHQLPTGQMKHTWKNDWFPECALQ